MFEKRFFEIVEKQNENYVILWFNLENILFPPKCNSKGENACIFFGPSLIEN